MEPTRVTMLMRGEKLFRNIERRATGRAAPFRLASRVVSPRRADLFLLLLSSNKTVGVLRGEK